MLKITVMPIVFMFLASGWIIPIGISYATYGDSPAFTTPVPTTTSANETNTNMTMPTSTSANETNTNMTMPTSTSANETNTNMTMPATPTNQTDTSKPSTPLTPLKQFKSGVSAKDVQCISGFSLVLKASDGSPACVHPAIVQILILRGWASIQ